MKLRDTISVLARVKLWLGYGQSYFMQFRYPVLLAIALKVYLPTASYFELSLLTLFFIFVLIFIGWFDIKFIHLVQTEAQISTQEYNPYFKKLKLKLSSKSKKFK